MSIRKYFLILLLLFGFVFSDNPIYAAEKLESVTLQLKWLHQFQFAGYYAAKEKGFYAEEELDVFLKERDPRKGYVQAVLDGKAEYGVADAGLLMDRILGKPVVLLKQIFQHSPLVYVSLKDSGIISPYDMVGKKVMFDKEGHRAPLVGMLMDTLGSLDKITAVPHSFNMEDLTSGNVDVIAAYITNETFSFKQQGIHVNIINPQNYGIDFYGDNLFTTKEEVKKHPERVEKMIRATLKGWEYALKHPDEIIDIIIKKYNPKLTREKLSFEAKMTDLMILSELTPLGSVTPHRYEQIAEIFVKGGLAKPVVDLSEFIYKSPKHVVKQPVLTTPALPLTSKEQAWLAKHPKIHVGIMNAWPPLNFVDEHNNPRGIGVDYIKLLNKRLNGALTIVPRPFKESYDLVKNKKLEVLMDITPKKAREPFFNFTKPYLAIPHVIVGHKDGPYFSSEKDLAGKTIALERGFYNIKYFRKNYPEVTIKEYDSTSDTLDAVSRGEADAYAGNRVVVMYLMEKELFANLQVQGRMRKPPVVLTIGVRKDWPELASILDRALASVTEEEIRQIRRRWAGLEDRGTEATSVTLTPEQKAWLDAHPEIHVGIMEAWPPMDFVDEMGTPRGIGVSYIDALNKRLGGRLIIVPGSWKEIYEKVKEKKLDALTGITPKEYRKPYFNFTKPYIKIPHSIVARKDGPYYQNEKDLSGKTIALERGFFLVKTFKENQPETTIKEYDSTSEALEAVAKSEADAYIGNRAVASYIIETELLSNLQIQGRNQGTYSVNAIGVRKDWPILAKILDRVLASVTDEEKKTIHGKWVTVGASPTASSNGQGRILPILGLVVGILIVFTAVLWLLMRLISDRLPSGLQAAGSRMAGLIIASVFVAAIVAYAWFGLRSMERQVRSQRCESLTTILLATQEALRIWLESEKEHIGEYTRDPRLIEIVKRHLEVTRTRNALLTSSSLKDLRAYFNNKEFHAKIIGCSIISKDLINIASMRDKNIGWHNLIAEQRSELLQKAFAGETVFVPPIHSDMPLIEQDSGEMQVAPHIMFLAAPVREEGGNVIAVMTLRFNPTHDFTRLCHLGQVGRSGETYAFDQTALLLSQSRFEDKLVQIGLLPKGKRSTLSVRISDPGGNLLEGHQPSTPQDKQPLTYMAASAVSGLAGTNADGYRDYRGVRVLGAWLWDEHLNIGLATEIDEQEVLATQLVHRKIVLSMLGLTVLLMSLLSGFVIWSGGQVSRSLKKARDDWEHLAQERMTKLRESENRFRSYFVSAPVGVAVTSPKTGWVDVNEHLCKMLGYTREELIKKTWSQIRVVDDLALDQEQFQLLLAGEIENYSLDARFVGKSGNTVYTDLAVACTRSEDGSVSKILLSVIDITERKKAEEAIKESEQQHKAIFENSPLGMVQFNADGKVIRFNINMLELLGATPEQLDGFDAGKELRNEDFKQALLTALHGEAAIFENWYTSVTGAETRYLRVIFNPIEEGAKSTEVIAIFEDITARKKMEENVRRNMEELERFSSMSVGREKQMIKLKEEINELLSKQGQEKKYRIVE